MYKIMIVEDEDIIRKGIIKSIHWNELGFDMIAEAVNGKEALDKISLNKPDIILTDIRMPIMDGLQLAKIVKEKYQDIQIVILSGFADFEYAKAAIQFHAFEYLLKPTDKKKFIETFKKLKQELDEKQQKKNIARIVDVKLSEGLAKLREEFINNLLNGEITSLYTLQERMNYLELDLTGNYYTVATILINTNGKNQSLLKEWKNDKKLISYAYSNIVGELLNVTEHSTVFVKDINEIVIVFCFENEEEQSRLLKGIVEDIIWYIQELIYNKEHIKLFAGIGLTYPDITQVNKSYLQSKKALEKRFFDNNAYLFHFEEGSEYNFEKKWIKDYPTEVNNIISETVSGNVEKVSGMIDTIFSRFIAHKTTSSLIKNYCYVLCFLLTVSLSEFKEEFGEFEISKKDFETDIKNAISMDSLKQYMMDLFITTAMQISDFKESEYSYQKKIIGKVKEYIEQNYSQSLSLQEISSHVYLSPTYLSFLFKSVTGETYVDYLKKIRMEKAKELLKRIDYKIYEIANMVGYNDYKYFTIQFKKMVGLSPTEFRDKG